MDWAEVLRKGLQRGSWNFRPATDSVRAPGKPLELAFLSPSSAPRWNLTAGKGLDGSALEKGTKGNNLSLTKRAVTVEDRGNYTCALDFNTAKLEQTLKVEVLQGKGCPDASVVCVCKVCIAEHGVRCNILTGPHCVQQSQNTLKQPRSAEFSIAV